MNNSKPKPQLRDILCSAVFAGIIGVLFALNLLVPAPAVLASERRVPAKFPEFSVKTVLSASFMDKFGDYAADHFVFRDAFRGIHAFTVFDIFRQSDKSGLYRSAAVGVGEFRRTDEKSFRQTAEKINKAAKALSDMGLGLDIHYSIVPDKSVYAERYMPGFDLGAAEAILGDVLGNYEYIRVADELGASSFYKTDLHWTQPAITATLCNRLVGAMREGPVGFAATDGDGVPGGGDNPDAPTITVSPIMSIPVGEFRGVYAGQLALPVEPDTMQYFEFPDLSARYLNETALEFEDGPVYDRERFGGVDPYDFFLRGPQPLIVLENAPAAGGTAARDDYSGAPRELYLFRDSFGSSLAPMLMHDYYDRVTLIDLRYINFALLDRFVEFTPDADVLFIYSSQIFNNPSVIQV